MPLLIVMRRKPVYKLITCIASEEHAKKAIKGLAEEHGIQAMVNHFARGFGRSASSSTSELGQQTEKLIFNVLLESQRVDEIFAYIFHAADLDRPHGGIIYVTAVNQSEISPPVHEDSSTQPVE